MKAREHVGAALVLLLLLAAGFWAVDHFAYQRGADEEKVKQAIMSEMGKAEIERETAEHFETLADEARDAAGGFDESLATNRARLFQIRQRKIANADDLLARYHAIGYESAIIRFY